MIDLSGLPILTLITFTPLVGAIVIAFLPRERLSWIRWAALGTALVAWALSLLLLTAFNPEESGFQFGEVADWVPAFGIQYKLGVDGISLALVVLTTTLTWISILASFGPIKERVKEYMISFLILEVGMTGVFLGLDMFLFYIFWELVLIPMYLIIGIWGGANRIYATIKFVLYTLVGSLLMLVAILAMAYTYQSATGSWVGAFDYLTLHEFGFDPTLQFFAFAAFFLAFAIKVPMFPFHTWLPDAHVEAPTPISMILAGVLLKLGGYGIIRICYPICPQAGYDLAYFVCGLGVLSMIYGAFAALAQKDFKRLVAYSSVSHMGYVVLGIGVWSLGMWVVGENKFNPDAWKMGVNGAMFQMIGHGISSPGMFFMVGVVYDRVHHRNLNQFGGLFARMPIYSGLAIGIFFAGLGLPGLCGFIGEVFVTLSVWNFNHALAVISASVVILTAAYILWTLQRVYLGPEYRGPHGDHLTPMTGRELAIAAPLLALAIVFGVYPQAIFRYMTPSVDRTVDELTAWTENVKARRPVEETALAPSLTTNEVATQQ